MKLSSYTEKVVGLRLPCAIAKGPSSYSAAAVYIYIAFAMFLQLWLKSDDVGMQMQENTSIAPLCCSLRYVGG